MAAVSFSFPTIDAQFSPMFEISGKGKLIATQALSLNGQSMVSKCMVHLGQINRLKHVFHIERHSSLSSSSQRLQARVQPGSLVQYQEISRNMLQTIFIDIGPGYQASSRRNLVEICDVTNGVSTGMFILTNVFKWEVNVDTLLIFVWMSVFVLFRRNSWRRKQTLCFA